MQFNGCIILWWPSAGP